MIPGFARREVTTIYPDMFHGIYWWLIVIGFTGGLFHGICWGFMRFTERGGSHFSIIVIVSLFGGASPNNITKLFLIKFGVDAETQTWMQ